MDEPRVAWASARGSLGAVAWWLAACTASMVGWAKPGPARPSANPGWQVTAALWIGDAQTVVPEGVATVVTVAEEPRPVDDHQVTERRHPFPDSRWAPVDHATVARALADVTAARGPVLVRCHQGINRSALTVALALRASGWTAANAIRDVRHARPEALTNPYFRDLIAAWPDDPMRPSEGAR